MIISKRQLFLLLLLSGYAEAHSQIQKQEPEIKNDSVYQLQEVVVSSRQILGSKFKARNRTGSAYYISPEEMKKRSEEHTSELQSRQYLVCRLLLEKKKII